MRQYLLDTNILVAYLRRGALQEYLEAVYQISQLRPIPQISIVPEAELRVIAKRHQWGAARMQALETLLAYLIVLPIPYLDSMARYVLLDAFGLDQGVQMGKNDLWIAATALASGATLMTTDRDFDHLYPEHLDRVYVDPASHL